MSDDSVRGRFLWHELMTTNTTSAIDFFSRVVGWKAQPWAQDPSYVLLLANGRQMAGLMRLPDDAKAMGTPPSWMSYIGTPNVDETAKQAVSLGGKILKAPTDIPTIGRFAVLQDPQGAVFLAFTPLPGPSGAGATAPTVGDFSWHELATTDARAALTFYQRLFGWEETSAMDMGPEMGTYRMFGWKGTTLGGAFNKPSSMPGPSFWLPYIEVADAKKTAAVVAQAGGRVINGPSEVPGGNWIAQGMDREGGMFAVHSAKPAAQTVVKKAAVQKTAAKKSVATKTAAKKSVAKKKTAPVKSKSAKKRAAGKPRKAAPARKKSAAKAKARAGRKKGRR